MAHVGHTIRVQGGSSHNPDCGVAPGDLLGARFRLGQTLGHGGQAMVFAGVDQRRGDAPVALKLARRDLPAEASAEAVAVLQWEAGLLRRLSHPALPRFLRFERSARLSWLARELVPGESLQVLARRGPQDPRQVLAWALQLCDLLSYLHTREVPVAVGDLKPANLVLRSDGRIALIDLGAAQTLTRRPPRRQRPRHGTPGYAPPEQLGSWGLDERADLFALAVTCYELLTGLDPSLDPLQFDLAQLDLSAPRMAPTLRWALILDLNQRCPTAAALRARLGALVPPRPLVIGHGIALNDRRDLEAAIRYGPDELAPVVQSGALEHWLAQHPDAVLGKLRYDLRSARRQAPARSAPIDMLFNAMAPPEGSLLLQFSPSRLLLGDVPLKRWRIWSRPLPLTLHNSAAVPLRWELSSPGATKADLRVLVDGKAQRRVSGVIAPDEYVRLEVVAMAGPGAHSGILNLRCGRHSWPIPWEATGKARLAIGTQEVLRLEDLDLGRRDLVPALEQLLTQGVLARWLRIVGHRALATTVAGVMAGQPSELERRLLIGRILSMLDPTRFPNLRLHGFEQAVSRPLTAGQSAYAIFELENLGQAPCVLIWHSYTAWAQVVGSPGALAPGTRSAITVRLQPPSSLEGANPVALALAAGDLSLPLVLPVQVTPDNFWQRMWRFFGS